MKYDSIDPPREFPVGQYEKIIIKDCGKIEMNPDEQVTFVTPTGTEYDVARKSWGYYATPSLNGRLKNFHLRGALMRGETGKLWVALIEQGQESDFEAYLIMEHLTLVCWLDSDEQVDKLVHRMREA